MNPSHESIGYIVCMLGSCSDGAVACLVTKRGVGLNLTLHDCAEQEIHAAVERTKLEEREKLGKLHDKEFTEYKEKHMAKKQEQLNAIGLRALRKLVVCFCSRFASHDFFCWAVLASRCDLPLDLA